MVLSYDYESQTVTATISETERYRCAMTACADPVCACQVLHLDFSPLDAGAGDDHRVSIDLAEKSLGFRDDSMVPRESLEFAEKFLNSLTDDDFNLLGKCYLSVKKCLTKEAKPEQITYPFNFREIEDHGAMVNYNEVLTFDDQLLVNVDDHNYVALDQHCVKPKCSCTETYLVIVDIDNPKSCCYLSLDYKKRLWNLHERRRLKLDLPTLRNALEEQFPNLYEMLQQRSTRLKAIYTVNKKKQHTPTQPLIISKPSRNEPCPCGSGKKYKKCCAVSNV